MIAKRVFDVACTLPGLIVLSPVLLVVAVLVKLDSSGPAFFRQTRIGKDERPFQLLKFRTMYVDAERHGPSITTATDPRVTRLGAFLRKSKVDELPQLINVMRGQMSLVGPRPEVPEYVAQYPTGVRKKVFSVQPGITDNASIVFRDEGELLSSAADPTHYYVNEILPRKLKLYEEYADNHSVIGDLKIIARTLAAIFLP